MILPLLNNILSTKCARNFRSKLHSTEYFDSVDETTFLSSTHLLCYFVVVFRLMNYRHLCTRSVVPKRHNKSVSTISHYYRTLYKSQHTMDHFACHSKKESI